MKIRPATILAPVVALGLMGVLAKNLTAGPAYMPRDKDVAKANREVAPPVGTKDEKAPLPEGSSLIGGAGVVEPRERESRLAGGSPGVIEKILVKEGDHPSADDVLVELERSVEEAAVKTSQAELESARANLERTLHGQRSEDRDAAQSDAIAAKTKAELSAAIAARTEKLAKDGAATQEELERAQKTASADTSSAAAADARARGVLAGSRTEDVAAARAAVMAAEARVGQAKATLERRVLRAPFGGEVLQVKARIGEYYTPGTSEAPVVLGDTSKLRARVDIDERDIAKIKLGQTGYVQADAYPNAKIPAKVVEIGRRMGRKNVRTDDPVERLDTKILEVVLEIDGTEPLVPGLRVTAFVKTTE